MQYELGYTPNNLKKLLNDSNTSQVEAYKGIGKSRAAFERYMHDVTDARHATMKHQDWLKLLDLLADKI